MAIRSIAYILFLLFSVSIKAQQTLPTEKVDVIKDFEVRLKDSEKKIFQPELPVLSSKIIPQSYDVSANPIKIDYAPPAIRPLAFKKEPDPQRFGSFIKVGGMLPYGFTGNLGIAKSTSDYSIGLITNHLQINNEEKIENQKNSLTEGKVFGNYFKGPINIKGQLGYSIQRIHYYGYNFRTLGDSASITSFPSEQVFQTFQMLDGQISLSNSKENKLKLDYSVDANAYNLKDNYAAKEQGLSFKGNLEKWIAGSHSLNVELGGEAIQYRDTSKQQLGYFNFLPSFAFRHRAFSVSIGANIISSSGTVSLFPSIKLVGQIIPKNLIIELGVHGKRNIENLRSLTEYNPYIKTRIQLQPDDELDIFARANGTIGKVNYEGSVSYKTQSALPLFNLVAGEVVPRFAVQFDTVKTFTIMAKGDLAINEQLSINGKFISRIFDAANNEAAWHRVGIEIQGGLTYSTTNQKLAASLFVNQFSRIAYLKGGIEKAYLLPILELSAQVDYKITENLISYVSVNNLTGNENARWLYYDRYGINPTLGLIAKF